MHSIPVNKRRKMLPKISVVIPTRNRPHLLANLLFSIIKQTTPPTEVLVIDDSDNNKTEELVKDLEDTFLKRGIILKYLRGNKANRSISNARNIGMNILCGDVVFFIDDDVILERNYVKEILRVYETYPAARGVQGFIVNLPFNPSNVRHLILNSFKKIFFLGFFDKNECSIKKGLSYPYAPQGIIRCEWLHGSNMSFRKEICTNFKFDNYFTLMGRSVGEDVRYASKINLLYPNSLFMNPRAKLCHISFPSDADKYRLYLTAISYFIFVATHELTFKNLTRIAWTLTGYFILEGISLILSRSKVRTQFYSLIKSSFFVIKHLEKIIKSDLRSFEKEVIKFAQI